MKKKNIFLWVLLFVFLTTYNLDLKKGPISSFFQIKKIEVNGVKNGDVNEIEKRLEVFKGENIITVDSKQFFKTIANLNFVRDIKVKKIYPDKIKIKIEEHNPIALFVNNKKKYILTYSGKIIQDYKKEFESLPAVYGKNANKNFNFLYKILKDSYFDINEADRFIYFEVDRWDILLKDGKLIKLPSNYEKSTDSIKKFLSIYKKENFQRFKVFDFRVKNQLIMK